MNRIRYDFAGQAELPSPQLVYYPERIRDNIQRMIEIAGGAERLWPHIKTHKMREVVKLLLEAGICRVKCATIAEAEMAAEAGVRYVLLAYPLVGPNRGRFLQLMEAYPQTEFYAIGDDTEQIQKLGQEAVARNMTVMLLMDVDTGQHRTGVSMERVVDLYSRWAELPGICLCGLHCYDGHRHESDRGVRDREVESVDIRLQDIKERFHCKILVMGGTPSFPCHAGMTQEYLSPGTCVIQDAGYKNAYPDLPFIPAAAVLTRVISRPSEDTMTLDLGTKAVASDPSGERAEIVGMEYAVTVLHNEEHWVVTVPKEHISDIPPIGTELFAIPTHICPTSALYPEAAIVEDGCLAGWWEVTARNRKLRI